MLLLLNKLIKNTLLSISFGYFILSPSKANDDLDLGVFIDQSGRYVHFLVSNFGNSDYVCDHIKIRANYSDYFGNSIGFRDLRSRKIVVSKNAFNMDIIAGEDVVCALENIFDEPYIDSVNADTIESQCYPELFYPTRDIVVNQSTLADVKFSPDGKRLLVASFDKTATVWSAETGTRLLTLSDHDGWVQAANFSTDGKRIVTGVADGDVEVWDSVSGLPLMKLEGHRGAIRDVKYSPDGKLIVTASSDKTIKVWNAGTAKLIRTLTGHSSWVTAIDISSDSRYLVSGAGDDTVKLWDLASGRLIRTFTGHTDTIVGIDISPDNQWVVSSGWDDTARVWHMFSGELRQVIEGHRSVVRDARFSPDMRWLLTGSDDRTAKIWSFDTGELLHTYNYTKDTNEVEFSPNGLAFATANGDGLVHIQSLESLYNNYTPDPLCPL